ncbi:hypothetical protein [Flavobacterium magnum]|nr:hypothetical protein [Flavobacterium magnum]
MNKGIAIIFALLLTVSCASRYKTVINDYVVLPEGKEVVGVKSGLHAFIFETLTKPTSFQAFLAERYPVDNFRAPEFWVTIDGSRYKILVYDNNELEKYFRVSEFIQTHFDTDPDNSNRPKFIAISMINEYNEDCLEERSLYYNVAVNFLKTLKQDYYKR